MGASIKTTPIGIAILIASTSDLFLEELGIGVADGIEAGVIAGDDDSSAGKYDFVTVVLVKAGNENPPPVMMPDGPNKMPDSETAGTVLSGFALVEAGAEDPIDVKTLGGKARPVELAGAEYPVDVKTLGGKARLVELAGVPLVLSGFAVKWAVAAVVNTLPATPLTWLQKSGSRIVY